MQIALKNLLEPIYYGSIRILLFEWLNQNIQLQDMVLKKLSNNHWSMTLWLKNYDIVIFLTIVGPYFFLRDSKWCYKSARTMGKLYLNMFHDNVVPKL